MTATSLENRVRSWFKQEEGLGRGYRSISGSATCTVPIPLFRPLRSSEHAPNENRPPVLRTGGLFLPRTLPGACQLSEASESEAIVGA